ncbi:MAG: type II toxin-antitoxin system VapC family toxin [Caldisphaera sp.]|jgi:predicted nucleic acid-binding protein|nr:MAG: hypothetical protein C0201_02485 [Caldisphaera sp.]PMP89657.1 MAG: hypothetical protein C0171_06815 [Caldisphaera sp.]
MTKYVYDASSIIKALKMKRIDILAANYIQQLTIHEILNAFWKECCLLKIIPLNRTLEMIDIIMQIVNHMKMLNPINIEKDIIKTASELGITTYDASYIVLAQKNNLILVTEDKKLKSKASSLINVTNVEKILSSTN